MALDALKRLAECGRLDVPAFFDAIPAGLTVMDKLPRQDGPFAD